MAATPRSSLIVTASKPVRQPTEEPGGGWHLPVSSGFVLPNGPLKLGYGCRKAKYWKVAVDRQFVIKEIPSTKAVF